MVNRPTTNPRMARGMTSPTASIQIRLSKMATTMSRVKKRGRRQPEAVVDPETNDLGSDDDQDDSRTTRLLTISDGAGDEGPIGTPATMTRRPERRGS
jgi:hypothetical protein